jgi:hypothetical protein
VEDFWPRGFHTRAFARRENDDVGIHLSGDARVRTRGLQLSGRSGLDRTPADGAWA